ncbi:MAG TPA: GEVED domain-containing protein, partial [Flavobacteriales bacterium]|nr:GEVED domain-containing protein [Flavobacteriales bacterium]
MKNTYFCSTGLLSVLDQRFIQLKNMTPKFLVISFALLLILVGGQIGSAQTVIQIGTGTLSPSVGTNPAAGIEGCSPYGVNVSSGAGGKKVQLIYTKAMIDAAMTTAGFTPGTAFIHNVGFNITGIVTSGFNHQNYTIKMANVAQADLSGGYYTGASTTVYGPTSFAPTATGWYSLAIGTPFQWDGTSNLCVEVCYNYTGVGLITTYGGCQYTAVGGNNHMGFAGGAAASCATAFPGTGSQTNRLSNMRLTVTSATPCSGAPAVSTAGSATVCSGTTTNIGLTGLVGASGYTYLWKYSAVSGGPYTPASGTNTNSTYTTPASLPSNPAYYICEVTCSGNTTPSNQGTVTLNSFLNCYCTSTFTSAAATTARGLTNVNLVGNSITINNTTAANTANPSPYNSYTTPVANITAGSTYSLKTTVGTATNTLHYTAAWIDYDNDGKFGGYTNAGVYNATGDYGVGGLILERISTVGPTSNIQTTANFTVPVNATTGNTAMRVRYRYGATLGGIGACQQITGTATSGGAGEVEDYRVFIASACVAPLTGASASNTSNILPTSVDLNWTNGSGTGGRIILVKQGSAVNSIPLSGTTYTDNATFGSGTQIGTGNYVVYDGTGSTTTISGLLPSTTYHYSIFEYNSVSTCYVATGHTGSFVSGSCSPTIQPSSIQSCSDYTSLNLSFARGNGDKTLVVARAGSAVNADPAYTSSYTASSTFGSGSQIGTGNYVVYNGNDPGTALVNLTGLTPGTTYFFKFYEYFEAPNCYNVTGVTTANSTTRNDGVYTSSTTTQNSTTVAQNSLAQQIIGLQVVVGGGVDPAATMNSITFNTTGSTNAAADIVNAKIFYTGTSSTFSNATQYGSTFTSFAGNLTATANFALLPGTNYFWVAYDLKLAATISNVLDASIVSFNLTDNTGTSVRIPTVLAPAGSRSIVSSAPSGYCIPSPAVEAVGDYITAPTWSGGDLGTPHTYGGGNSSGSGVNNRTAQPAPTLTPGVTYTLSYYAEDFIGNTNSVWIDWDQSGTWNATAPELVRNSGASFTVTQSVTVPLTATPGATRMRIINRFPSAGTNACVTSNGSSTSAVYVDYTVTIAGAVGVQAVSCATLAPVVTTPVTYAKNDIASQLTATGTGLLWYTASTGGVGSSTAPTPVTSAAGTTAYYVSQTSGCEGPRTQIAVTVTTSCGPNAFTVTGGNNCSSSTVGLANSETGVSYQLYLDGSPIGSPIPGSTGNPISFGPQTTPGLYTIDGTDSQPVTTLMTGSSRVYVSPTATITGSLVGCSPAGATLTSVTSLAGSGFISSRQWKLSGIDIPLETAITLDATVSGNYSVEITNSNNCSTTSSVSVVSINLPPSASFSGGNIETCENQSVTISDAVYANDASHTWTIISGNGSLSNTAGYLPIYTPSSLDAGTTVQIQLTVSNAPCADAIADKYIDIAPRPDITPTSALISPSNTSQMITVTNIDINSNYTWLPINDLYTDVDLTTPYISGTSATTVYSAPFSTITYNVIATNTITGCATSATSITVNVDPAITNQICDANLPSGLVNVTSTPTFELKSLTGSSASPGASCAGINRDIWFRAIVPVNGEIHVITKEHDDPITSKNITSALVQIFTAATCSTSVSSIACDAGGGVGNMAYARAGGLTPGSTVYIRLARTTTGNAAPAQFIKMAVTSGLIWSGALNNDFSNPGNWVGGDATSLTVPSSNTTVIIPASPLNNYPVVYGTQNAHGIEFTNYSGYSSIPSITINPVAELRLTASATYKSFITKSG